jgi:hypothetical protein
MDIHLKPLEDAAAAIGNAMERACMSGDMETAERHFVALSTFGCEHLARLDLHISEY